MNFRPCRGTSVLELKDMSCYWQGKQDARYAHFAWQRGDEIFSAGKSQLATLQRYLKNQEAHQRRRTFQHEFRDLGERYGVSCDEAYGWD